jgi:hypothetical protein
MPRNQQPGSERARDEQRSDRTPRYAGAPWEVADERAPDERFGKARTDDSDPSELASWERDVVADTGIESGAGKSGFGRGEKPRKPKARTKPNPKPKKTRAKRTKAKRR